MLKDKDFFYSYDKAYFYSFIRCITLLIMDKRTRKTKFYKIMFLTAIIIFSNKVIIYSKKVIIFAPKVVEQLRIIKQNINCNEH